MQLIIKIKMMKIPCCAKKLIEYQKRQVTQKKDIKDCTYLIELEITKEAECQIGDKYCNR